MLTREMTRLETLQSEAHRLGRYLGTSDLPQELADRYREANLALFPEPPSDADSAVLECVRRHPWSLPLLESALGLIRPDALLRRKLVVMMAILETEPGLAENFEALTPGPAGAVLRLVGLGISSAVKIAAGILLYPCVKLLAPRVQESQGGPGA